MKRTRILILATALTAGVAAFMVAGSRPEPAKQVSASASIPTDDILVAANDISFGSTIGDGDLRWQSWSKASVPPGVIRKADKPDAIDDLRGALTRDNIGPGEPLDADRLIQPGQAGFMAAILPAGSRAVAINIDTQGSTTAGGFILPNDHVDVMHTFEDDDAARAGGDGMVRETILRNVRVLAFPAQEGRGLDHRTAAQVLEFGTFYRNAGEGPINVFVPADNMSAPSRGTIEAVRRALAIGGAAVPLQISSYPVVNHDLASPIRLNFVALKAKVADPCGQWPTDLASGTSVQGWENKPYWNFGCSYQSMIAEQVADPRDLVGPRAEDPADTQMRSRGISDLRKGTDPTTDWKTKNTSISTIGTD